MSAGIGGLVERLSRSAGDLLRENTELRRENAELRRALAARAPKRLSRLLIPTGRRAV